MSRNLNKTNQPLCTSEELQQTFSEISSKIYQQASQQQQQQGPESQEQQPGGEEDSEDVYEADYEVEDEEEK